MTTVVLADDEALLRKALAALLPLEGEIAVLAGAEDGEGAVRATLEHRPDVLVIDLEMPAVDGLAAVAEIRRTRPDQVMLTRHARPGVLRKALKLGVQGFVSKSAEPAHITSVIRTLHEAARYAREHDWLWRPSTADIKARTSKRGQPGPDTKKGRKYSSCHFQRIPHPGACGKTLVAAHNRPPWPGPGVSGPEPKPKRGKFS
ncbi:response regulator [Amycolatopsis sp. NPDC047767]|uniref:response regulator n=1 Tax=Amycolatopsis sp. NPDC047767 TaxID=3156765 RepID=UPI0034524DDD